MSWQLQDPTGQLAVLNELAPSERLDLREALASILHDPFTPPDPTIRTVQIRALTRGDPTDVLVAALPHDWSLTYRVHQHTVTHPGTPRIVIDSLAKAPDPFA